MRASTPSSSSSSTSCSTSSSSSRSFLPVSSSNERRRRRRRRNAATTHLSLRRSKSQEKQEKRRQQKTGVLDTNDVVYNVARRCESGDDGDGRRGRRRKKTRSRSRDVRTFSSSSSSSSNKKVVSAATAFENATTSVSIDWNSQIRKAKDERVGVLLLNLGGPETLDDVEPFLFNLFADPDIIRLPSTSFKLKRIWFLLLLLFFFFVLKMMCSFDLIFVVAFFSRFVYARIVFCLCLCLCARYHRNLTLVII